MCFPNIHLKDWGSAPVEPMGVLPLISVSARSAPNPSMGEGVGCCVHIVDADSGDSGSKLTALTSSLGQLIVRGGRGGVSANCGPIMLMNGGEGVRLVLCWLLLLYVCSSCLHYQSWGRGRNRVKRHQPVQGKSLNSFGSDKLPTVQFLRPSLVKPRNWTWEPHKNVLGSAGRRAPIPAPARKGRRGHGCSGEGSAFTETQKRFSSRNGRCLKLILVLYQPSPELQERSQSLAQVFWFWVIHWSTPWWPMTRRGRRAKVVWSLGWCWLARW